MSSSLSKIVRIRMAATGEKYTAALRWLEAHPEERARIEADLFEERAARRGDTEPA
jgi:hypothetical protein